MSAMFRAPNYVSREMTPGGDDWWIDKGSFVEINFHHQSLCGWCLMHNWALHFSSPLECLTLMKDFKFDTATWRVERPKWFWRTQKGRTTSHGLDPKEFGHEIWCDWKSHTLRWISSSTVEMILFWKPSSYRCEDTQAFKTHILVKRMLKVLHIYIYSTSIIIFSSKANLSTSTLLLCFLGVLNAMWSNPQVEGHAIADVPIFVTCGLQGVRVLAYINWPCAPSKSTLFRWKTHVALVMDTTS